MTHFQLGKLTMRLKSKQQQQPQRQQQQQQQRREISTNQKLKSHVTISVISRIIAVALVVVGFCLLLIAPVVAAAAISTSANHPAAIKIGDPKTRIPRQVAEADKAVVDDCDCDILDDLYHKPHFAKGRSVIVQMFEWKFMDVAEECRTFFGPMGYGGVQLSPVLEHTIIKTDNLKHPWWQRFETVSYRFASRSGDESDFWGMSRICNDNGVRIYLDVVFNHMAAPLTQLLKAGDKEISNFTINTLLEANVNISNMSYANVPYTAKHFHRPCVVGEAPATHFIRNCQLNGHPDLDIGNPEVEEHIVEMLNKFIDMGVAGFQVNSAKYVWPHDFKNIYAKLKDLSKDFGFEEHSRPFMYHDIFDMGLDSISKTEYATYGAVTEYLYPIELSTILRGKVPLSSLINWGPAMGFLSHQDSVVFVDSPETQRGLPKEMGKNRVLSYKNHQKYIMANALMMVHPYGRVKRIMSSYYFKNNNIDQGPPVEAEDIDAIRSPEYDETQQCTAPSGWVCEHRWPEMVQLVALANYFSIAENLEESVIHFQTNGPNHIAFCRGHKAFVAMNNDPDNDFMKDVFTCLEPGTYCDVISGGLNGESGECHGLSVEVNETGYTKLNLLVADDASEGGDGNVPENLGVLIVYVGSKVGSKMEKIWQIEEPILKEVSEGNIPEPGAEDANNNEENDGEAEGGEDANNNEETEKVTQFPFNQNVEGEVHDFFPEEDSFEGTDEDDDEVKVETTQTDTKNSAESPADEEKIETAGEEEIEENVDQEAEVAPEVNEDKEQEEEVNEEKEKEEETVNAESNDPEGPDEGEKINAVDADENEEPKIAVESVVVDDDKKDKADDDEANNVLDSADELKQDAETNPEEPLDEENIEAADEDSKSKPEENEDWKVNENSSVVNENNDPEVPDDAAEKFENSENENLDGLDNVEGNIDDKHKEAQEELKDMVETNNEELQNDEPTKGAISTAESAEDIEQADKEAIINDNGEEVALEAIDPLTDENLLENEIENTDGNEIVKDLETTKVETITFSSLDGTPDSVEYMVDPPFQDIDYEATESVDLEEAENDNGNENENEIGDSVNPQEGDMVGAPTNSDAEQANVPEVEDTNLATEVAHGSEENPEYVDSSMPEFHDEAKKTEREGKENSSKDQDESKTPNVQIERPVVVNVEQSVQVYTNNDKNDNTKQEFPNNAAEKYQPSTAEVGNRATEVLRGAMFPASRNQLQMNAAEMKKCSTFIFWLIIAKILTMISIW